MRLLASFAIVLSSVLLTTSSFAQAESDHTPTVVVQLADAQAQATFDFLTTLDMGNHIEDGLTFVFDTVEAECHVLAKDNIICKVTSAKTQRQLAGSDAAKVFAFIANAKKVAGIAFDPTAETIHIRDLKASYTVKDHYWGTKAAYKASYILPSEY